MERIASWILNHRTFLIVIVLLATIVFGFAALGTEFNTDLVSYLSDDSEPAQEFDRVGEVFDSNYIALVVFQAGEDELFRTDTLAQIDKLTAAYEQLPGVASVLSLTNAPDVRDSGWGVEVGTLVNVDALSANAENDAVRRRVMQNEMYRGTLFDVNGTSTALVLMLEPDADHLALAREITDATARISEDDPRYYFGGMPFTMFSMERNIMNNLGYLAPLILLLLVGLLYLGFRSLRAVMFPMLVVLISVIWTLGILALAGVPLDMLTSVAPVILIAMGCADGIHLIRQYLDERREGRSVVDAMQRTVSDLGVPVILTSLTTMVGFASLVVSEFSIIRTFGYTVSLGIFVAMVVTLAFLPALATIFDPTPRSRGVRASGTTWGRAALRWLADVVFYRRTAVMGATVVVVLFAAVGIPRIVVNVDWSLCLARGGRPYQAEMLLRDRFGGSLPLQVSVQGDVRDPVILREMASAQAYADSLPMAANTSSMATMIAETNQVLNGRFALPDTSPEVENLWALVEGQKGVNHFVTREGDEALVQGRLRTMATADMRESTRAMARYVSQLPSEFVVVDRSVLPTRDIELLDELRLDDVSRQMVRLLPGAVEEEAALAREIEEVLAGEVDTAKIREELTAMAIDFLTGASADVPVEDGDSARRIAGVLLADIGQGGTTTPTREQIEEVLHEYIETADHEDIYWMADSLEYRLTEWTQTLRVEERFAALEQARPDLLAGPASEGRWVRAALWQLEGNSVTVAGDTFEALRDRLEPAKVRRVPVNMEITGLVPVLNQMEERLMPTQIGSLALTLAVVLAALALIFRSLKVGLVGIVPTLLTVVTNFAILGYAGIGLDSFTAIIAAVVIGLGIDYTIHFISRFRRELDSSREVHQALRRTFETTGAAIVLNALSVGLGFAVLVFATGQHLQILGGLLALALVLSAVYTLVILPVLIMAVKPKFYSIAIHTGKERR